MLADVHIPPPLVWFPSTATKTEVSVSSQSDRTYLSCCSIHYGNFCRAFGHNRLSIARKLIPTTSAGWSRCSDRAVSSWQARLARVTGRSGCMMYPSRYAGVTVYMEPPPMRSGTEADPTTPSQGKRAHVKWIVPDRNEAPVVSHRAKLRSFLAGHSSNVHSNA